MLTFPGQEYRQSSAAATAALLFEDFASNEIQKLSSSVPSSVSDVKPLKSKDQGHSSISTDPKPIMNKDHNPLACYEINQRKEITYSIVPASDMSTEPMPPDFVAINISDGDVSQAEANRKLNDDNRVVFVENGDSLACDEGTEMELLKKRDVYTTRATFEVGLGDGKKPRIKDAEQETEVDLSVKFPLLQSEKANGVEPLQLPSTYNSVNCFLGQTERNGSTYQSLSTTGSTLSNSLRVEGTKTLITNVFPMQHISVLAIPPSSSWLANAFAPDMGKSFDENDNAVTHGHRDFNNGNERKSKTRRTKTNNDRNVVMSQNIEGHRGDKDIDSLLEFIESDKERKVKASKSSTSHRSSNIIANEKGAKSRDRKLTQQQHMKGENHKLKKTNSLEEISKTKLEDLTSEKTGVLRKPKKQSTMDDADLSRVGDRRSWSNQESQEYYFNDPASADENFPSSRKKRRGEVREDNNVPSLPTEETDFHVVTKKQRRKKRPSSSGSKGNLFDETRRTRYNQQQRDKCDSYQRRSNSGFPPHDRDVLYQYHRPIPPDLRRKSTSSMPPSDKSDSSDLDSVHSLPISSTTPKLTLDQMSTSSGSTPQASYADIAKISSANPTNINVSTTKWPAITSSSLNPNPQSITSSKVNIGVPPISGKVTANPVPSVPSSLKSEDGEEPDSVATHLEPPAPSNSKPLDPRPKRNAVINTLVDIKVIPPYQTDDKFFAKQVVENSSNKVTLNNIQIEITDRTIKVSPAINTYDGVIKKKFVDLASKPETGEVIGKLIVDNNSDVVDSASAVPVVAICENAAVAGLPAGEPQVLLSGDGAGVPISKVAKSDLYENKSITRTGKVNTGSKKPTVSLSITARPAVIILDEKESVFVSQNISASDITFGFEVNELLLLSDGDESLDSSGFNSLNVSDKQSVDRTIVTDSYDEPGSCEQVVTPVEVDQHVCNSQDVQDSQALSPNSSVSQLERESLPAEENQQVDLPKALENTPNQSTKVDEFFARFKSPITQLTDSHTKIVNIIGLAWADVMQEMEAGGDVQYYDGQ